MKGVHITKDMNERRITNDTYKNENTQKHNY